MNTVTCTMLARLPPARFMIWSICENPCFTCASKLLAMSLPSLSRVAVWPATQTILPPSVTTPGENARDNWNGVFSMYSAAVATIGSKAIAASTILGNVGMRSIAFSRANGVDGTRAQVTEARAKATLAQTIVENKRAAVSCAGAVAGEPCFGSASMLRSTQRRPSHATPSKHPHERVRSVAARGGRDPLRLLGARRSGRARAGKDRAAHLHPRGARRLARQDA